MAATGGGQAPATASSSAKRVSFPRGRPVGAPRPRSCASIAAQCAAVTSRGRPSAEATAAWLRERRPRLVTAAHWAAIDAHERGRGAPTGRPRVKLTRFAELLAVAGA